MNRDATAQAVLLTGGLGSGKTAVAIELGEALEAAGASFAVLDLDWLCWAWSPSLAHDGVHALLCDNLRAIVPQLLGRDLRHLVLARAVLSPEGLDQLVGALAPIPVRVVRLTADETQVAARLRARDSGARLAGHLDRLVAFEAMVQAATPDAPVVDTTSRDAATAAAEVRDLLGWPRPLAQ